MFLVSGFSEAFNFCLFRRLTRFTIFFIVSGLLRHSENDSESCMVHDSSEYMSVNQY
jgi:hypothetical protein